MSTGKKDKRIVPRTTALVREFDPSIEPLENTDSYWFLSIIFAILVAGIVGLYLWSDSMEPVSSDSRQAQPAQVEITSPQPRSEISPLESARAWREDHLAGTEFAALPIRDADEGCFLVYTARSGDSLPGVLTRYRPYVQEDSTGWKEACDAACAHHDLQYDHGLWPGDEIWLLLPQAGSATWKTPPGHQAPPAEGASVTSLREI